MAYTRNPTWVDGVAGGTRIDAADLNNIEDGLVAAANVADSASSAASAAQTAATTAQGTANSAQTTANNAAAKASNLADLASPSTALTNLGGVPTTRTITAGTGLTGGGDLSANRTLTVAADAGLPSQTGNSGKYLTTNGTSSSWAAVSSSGTPFGYQKLATGMAVRMYDANRVDTNAYNTLNRLTFAPFYMAYGSNLLRHFYVNVGTTAASSVIRLGIYSAGTDGMPGSLVVDLGTVSGSAATGDVVLSRSAGTEIQLSPGLYFLAAVIQTAACTVARYVSSYTPYGSGIYGEAPQTTTGAANNNTIPYQDSVTGALPATATISGLGNTGIYMAARVQ